MSELVVSSNVAVTGAAASTLLALAGVAVDALAALTGDDFSVVPGDVEADLRVQTERTRAHLLATLGNQLDRCRSGTVAQAAAPPAAARALAEAGAVAATLRVNPAVQLVANAHRAAGIETGIYDLHLAQQAWRDGDADRATTLAHRSREQLSAALTDAVERLAAAHRRQVADGVGAVLGEMGYRVARADRSAGVGFWAERDVRVVGVAVLRDGTLVTDIAGCEGGRCEIEAYELFRRLRARGIDTRREATLRHLRRDGGQLINAARRSGRGAAGLVDAAADLSRTARHETLNGAGRAAASTAEPERERARRARVTLGQGRTR